MAPRGAGGATAEIDAPGYGMHGFRVGGIAVATGGVYGSSISGA
ncbi:MAG: hypothetical protein QOE08_258 [Thermoleophilaceae bacterium]|nr:hypothetical protein [Thermoleophilaceae bacterium]